MANSTGVRCKKIKALLSNHPLVDSSQLKGSVINIDNLDLDLQDDLEKFSCDMPIIRQDKCELNIYFSCCTKQEIIKISVKMLDLGHVEIVRSDVLNCISTQVVA
ncbi:MAG: hypothetical protein ACPHY8_02515 [Patescibacteria group bacterium]